jgi:predicted DCC family thiol-disulfide oxidoreductase YuxK
LTAPAVVQQHPRILFFDGVCVLCSGWVEFVYRRDQEGRIAFAPLQSGAGRQVLRWMDLPEDYLEMMIYVEEKRVYTRSGAFLKIAGQLRFPWNLLRAGWLVPEIIRDWVYDRAAEIRYRVFGKLDHCLIPPEDLQERFIDVGDGDGAGPEISPLGDEEDL